MKERMNYFQASPGAMQAMVQFESYVAECYENKQSLDYKLVELVKMRVSQINGCGYCLDMHSKDARANGETEQRLYGLSAWREAPYYSDQERAALGWAEALTHLSTHGVSDDLYAKTRDYLTEEQLVDLTHVVNAINAWNRYAISFRTVPGTYERVESA